MQDVALRIVEGYDGHLMEWVQRGNVDTTLLYGPAADLHLRVRPLFLEELRLVFRPGTVTQTSLTLAEAAERPLILPSRPHGLRKIVEAAFHVAHVSMPVRFEVDSYTLIKDLTERGLGCAILPRSSIRQSEAAGRLASASLEPPLKRQIVRALRPGPDPDRATDVTLALMDSIIAVRATAGDWKLFEPNR